MKRLGITSVEEEICPVGATVACGGISKEIFLNPMTSMPMIKYLGRESLAGEAKAIRME